MTTPPHTFVLGHTGFNEGAKLKTRPKATTSKADASPAKAGKFSVPGMPVGIAGKHWKGTQRTFDYGQERLRFWWLNEGQRVNLGGWVEAFSWDDQGDTAPVVSGSMTLRQSLVHAPIPPIRSSDVVLCEIQEAPGLAWHQVARLRVSEPSRQASGQFTFQIANDASLLTLSKDDWKFSKGKGHPKGWAAWQIVAEVCRRCQIRLVMPRVGRPIHKFPPMLNASAFDVINAALKKLREQEHKFLVARFEQGTLYLSQRHYSTELLALGPQLMEASLTETRRDDFATALTLRTAKEVAHGKDAKGKKKVTHSGITVELSRPAYVQRYGYVHAVVYAHGASSKTEVRALGLYHLARVLQPNRALTLSAPYIPGLRRGAYLRLALPTLGLRQIVYVRGISYNASAGSLTMEVTVGFDDPQITPPIDRVNASAPVAKAKKKKTNPKPSGTKKDAATAKKPPKSFTLGHTGYAR